MGREEGRKGSTVYRPPFSIERDKTKGEGGKSTGCAKREEGEKRRVVRIRSIEMLDERPSRDRPKKRPPTAMQSPP